MPDVIIFEAGNFGAKSLYSFDGVSLQALFDISGTFRTAVDTPEGFAFFESSTTQPQSEIKLFDENARTITTVHVETDPTSGSGYPALTSYGDGFIFKDYGSLGGGSLKLYQNGTTTELVAGTNAPFNNGSNGGGNYGNWLGIAGETIFTSGGDAGNELAISNGRSGGTTFEDFIPRSLSSNGSPRDFTEGDGGVYFIGDFPNGGTGSFISSGSGLVFGAPGGGFTVLSRAEDPGPTPSINDIEFAGDDLFVAGRRPISPEDGSPSDTGLFRLNTTAPFALELVASGFNGAQLNPAQLTDFGDLLLFESSDNLFVSDGTFNGTTQLTFNLSDVTTIAAGDTKAYFWGTSANAGKELWVTDGTAAGTSQVLDLRPGASGQQGLAIRVIDDTAYFEAFSDTVAGLWQSDGTAAGTELVFAGGRTPMIVSLDGGDGSNQTRPLINQDLGPRTGTVDASGVGFVRNTAPGTPGNDVIGSLGRSERVDLLDGLDRFIISAQSDGFTKTVTASGVSLTNGAQTYILDNTERVSFVDGTLFLDTGAGETAGAAYRIYQAAFNRTPDNDGLEFWLGHMDNGVSLQVVAQGFLNSEEFTRLYGQNVTNAEYVDRLYENVLQRDGDAAGVAFWLDVLDRNAVSRSDVLAYFSESPENVQGVAPIIQDGFFLI